MGAGYVRYVPVADILGLLAYRGPDRVFLAQNDPKRLNHAELSAAQPIILRLNH